MKRTAMVIAGLVACLGLVGFAGCGSSDDDPTATISGAITQSNAPDGVKCYMKLVAHGGSSSAAALYFAASSEFSGGQATYSMPGVKHGSYTGYAFIDMNNNAAGDNTSMPDAGDYVTDEGGDVVIDGDWVSDIPQEAWILLGE
jgi:ABC-type phosphate transport system substrate-binding protein